MLELKNKNGTFLKAILICAMLSSSAQAGRRDRDYRATCESGKTQSDQQKAYCAEAKLSLNTKNGEAVKTIAFIAGSAATIALAVAGPTSEAICPAIAASVSGFGVATDLYVGIKNNDIMNAVLNSAMGLLGGFGVSSNLSNIPFIGKKIADKNGCIAASVALGIQGIKSGIGLKGAQAAFDASHSAAKSLVDARATQLPSGFSINPGSQGDKNSPKSGKVASVGDGLCANDPNYGTCIKNAVPEISAITNSPALMGEINKGLKGKSFEDFLKGYDSDKSSPEAYVASALGVSPASMGDFSNSLAAVAKEKGVLDKYSPMTYSSASKTAALTNGDLDFTKMMNDMLKQMNPDGTQKESKDAADLVFRQLDLLPADKIEARSDISLFARVGYRYRKKTADVEQLHYSSSLNQTADPTEARVPASSH